MVTSIKAQLISFAAIAIMKGSVTNENVQCPPDIRRQRLSVRGNDRDQAKLQDWDSYIKYCGEEHPPVFEHVLVDGVPDNAE